MIARGARVVDVADCRHEGIVTQVNLRRGVRYANIRWDNGLRSSRIPCADLRIVPPENAFQSEPEQLRGRITRLR